MHFSEDPLRLQYKGFIGTPPLWLGKGSFGLPQYSVNLYSPLPESCTEELYIPDNLVLGRRVEYFLLHYLQHFTSEEILANNLVVNSAERTLGELDFLLRNKESGQGTHLELVYKFYLYDPSLKKEIDRWIGPNRGDTLIKKLIRLASHQFPLLYKRETQDLLSLINISSKDFEQRVCFKATLFVPLEDINRRFPLINNNCVKGYWIKTEEFTEKEYGSFEFHTPSKWNWPIDPSTCRNWCTFEEIHSHILHLNQLKKSPLVWMKKRQGKFFKIFVVWW